MTEQVDRDKVARLIMLDHLQLLSDFDVDGDIYRKDPECAASAYSTADAIIAALTVTPQEAAKVLEWQNDEHLLVENATSTALTPFGRYYATASSFWGPGTIISTGYTSEEMAQAQAQKDYSFRLSRAISEDSHE